MTPRPDDHDDAPVSGSFEHDALVRLEDVLRALPFDRAVPDLAELLARAGIGEELLRRDDRAYKLVHEALLARPFGNLDVVQQVRTEVELLTLEVELLTERLADQTSDRSTVERAVARLTAVRLRLDELGNQL